MRLFKKAQGGQWMFYVKIALVLAGLIVILFLVIKYGGFLDALLK